MSIYKKNIINKKNIMQGVTFSCLMLASGSLLAACTWHPSIIDKPIQAYVSFGTISVGSDVPINTVIARKTFSSSTSSTDTMFCSDAFYYSMRLGKYTTPAGAGDPAFATEIPGIALRISAQMIDAGNYLYMGDSNQYLQRKNDYLSVGNLRAELIKTIDGPVGGGRLISGSDLGKLYNHSYGDLIRLTFSGTNAINPVACTVDNSLINVNLESASNLDFKGIGSTAKPKLFNIGLNCDAGTNVKVKLDGTSAGGPGVLALNSGEGQAKGLGIQLLKGDTPIVLGTAVDFGSSSSAGERDLELTARYYQTESIVDGGKTNTSATFTITFE